MKTIYPTPETAPQTYHYLNGSVGPRPIAFASTVDAAGRPNLAPFSYYNVFGVNPPVLVFSPVLSLRTGKAKDTLLNIEETGEVVVNAVTYGMVRQMSLASAPFERGVSEFEKAGFTPLASELVRPPRVKEAPVQFECKVLDVVRPSVEGGAAQLVVAEVLAMHFAENVLDGDGLPDPHLLDLVARMGGNHYCRAHGDALFEIPSPPSGDIVAWDALPQSVRESEVLTGNRLGMLAGAQQLPDEATIGVALDKLRYAGGLSQKAIHQNAADLLDGGRVGEAWAVLLAAERL